MQLAAWIRERLWTAPSWCAELAALRGRLGGDPQRTWELACATEHCDPDRGRALALYVDAWRRGHRASGDRARVLARELRAHMTLAELALANGELVAAASSFIDAGFPELALEPLHEFVDARPPGATPTTEIVRLEPSRPLLAIARREAFDAERLLAETLARAARSRGAAAVEQYHLALRIARAGRLANVDAIIATILATAVRACPDDADLARELEEHALERNNANALLDLYRARFETAADAGDYVAHMRAAACELLTRNLQPGLGLRLLRRSLEQAYQAMLPEIHGHLAAWELLVTHARIGRTTVDLVPLIVQALAAPLSEDDALYLSALGLEIVWRDAGDTLAAQPYAAAVLDFAAEHPTARAFMLEVDPQAVPEPEPVAKGTVKMPALVRPPVADVAPPPAPKQVPASVFPDPERRMTGKLAAIDDGFVKRAPAPPAAVPHSVTGRLALLKPPPPRATTLKRDTSPFPISPRPRGDTAQRRAERKVVPIDAVIELPDGGFFSTVLRDVSASGAFIVTKRALEIGTVIGIDLDVPSSNTLAQTSFRVTATVVRRTEVGCGIAFVTPSPELVDAIVATTA